MHHTSRFKLSLTTRWLRLITYWEALCWALGLVLICSIGLALSYAVDSKLSLVQPEAR